MANFSKWAMVWRNAVAYHRLSVPPRSTSEWTQPQEENMTDRDLRGLDRRTLLRISAGGAALATLPLPAWGQPVRHGKMEYGIASIDSLYAAAYVTLKQNLFQAEGLEVSYINSQSGPRSKQMLAAGQLFVTTTGVNDSVALSLAGKSSTVVLSFDRRVPFANILVHKDNLGPGKLQTVKD